MSRLIEREHVKNMRAQRYMSWIAFAIAELMMLSVFVIYLCSHTESHPLDRVLGIIIPCLSVQIIYLARATDDKLLDKLLKQGHSQTTKPH